MTYQQCLDYLFSQLPMYQRIGQAAYKADLNNTIELLSRLGNPERKFKSIHVAGTNGKGSVSHMLASVLQENGYKTGLYTSPHLKDFRERIKINGQMIPENQVLEFVEKHLHLVEDINPSFFEWTVALAFQYFAEERVDIAVIEVGMGGRLDSTNVIDPLISVITNIGFDHMAFLGDSLEKIAMEKAGIIKDHVPVVIGKYLPETSLIFSDIASKKKAPLILAQEKELPPLDCDLKGPYQKENQQSVLHALMQLKELGLKLEELKIKEGMANVVKNTGLRGRWEWIGQKPGILLDTAHNVDGIKIVLGEIQKMKFNQLHLVWGMVSDKDITKILELLPKKANYYFCRPNIPRGMEVKTLIDKAALFGISGNAYDSVLSALEAAKKVAESDDLIYVGGSTFVVAEALP